MENKITIDYVTEAPKKESPLWWLVCKVIGEHVRKWGYILIIILTPIVLELAHMLTALAFGMTVETYNVGFGPSLFHFEAGGIVYHWRLILLGGYVSINESMSTFPLWQQLLVMLAGCAINLLTALLLAKLFIRNWWVWIKASWSYMGITIWNIIMKTFFLPWRLEEMIEVDTIINPSWTRYTKRASIAILAYAFFSINLGLFNLIPFVGVLDGGKITSMLLTPLIGATTLNLITFVLWKFVIYRWCFYEYGILVIYRSIQKWRMASKEEIMTLPLKQRFLSEIPGEETIAQNMQNYIDSKEFTSAKKLWKEFIDNKGHDKMIVLLLELMSESKVFVSSQTLFGMMKNTDYTSYLREHYRIVDEKKSATKALVI